MENVSYESRHESLVLLHKDLTSLDSGYEKVRLQMSRKQYIDECFGGDFLAGSIIVLDYLSGDYSEPDDIVKISEVRDIITRLEAHYESLDMLHSFSFDESSSVDAFLKLLNDGQFGVDGPVVLGSQDALTSGKHYYVQAGERVKYVPIMRCTTLKVFTKPMAALVAAITKGEMSCEVGDTIKVVNRSLRKR